MKEPKLPQGYEYLGDIVKKAQGRLRELDELIDNVQQDRYDTPSPAPAGAISPGIRGQQANEMTRLNGEKETVRSDANKAIDAELKDVDPATKKEIKDHAEHQLADGVYDKGTMKAFEKKQSEFDRLRDTSKSKRETIENYLDQQERDSVAPTSALDKTNFGQFMAPAAITAELERQSPEHAKEPQPNGPENKGKAQETVNESQSKAPKGEGQSKEAENAQPNNAEKGTPGKEADDFKSHGALYNSSFAQGQAKSDLATNYSVNAKDITSPQPDKE